MKPRSRWTWAWLAWLALFLATEVPAACRRAKLDTFSEHVWDWFGIGCKKPYGVLRRVVLALFLVALSAHFIFGAPGGWAIIVTGIPVGMVILYSLVRE